MGLFEDVTEPTALCGEFMLMVYSFRDVKTHHFDVELIAHIHRKHGKLHREGTPTGGAMCRYKRIGLPGGGPIQGFTEAGLIFFAPPWRVDERLADDGLRWLLDNLQSSQVDFE